MASLLFMGEREDLANLAPVLETNGYKVDFEADETLSIKLLREHDYAVVMVSCERAGDGLVERLAAVARSAPGTALLVWTDRGPSESLRSALNGKVTAYLSPHASASEALAVIAHAVARCQKDALSERRRERLVKLELDFRLAADVQKSLGHGVRQQVPPTLPGLKIGGTVQPYDLLGGDFCGWFSLPGDLIGVYLGDAAGHDLQAWMVAQFIEHELDLLYALQEWDILSKPAALLSLLNMRLYRGRQFYASMVYLVIHQPTGQVFFASGGHTPFFARTASNHVDLYFSRSPSLGLVQDAVFTEMEINLYHYTHLSLYSDGLGGTRFRVRPTENGQVDAETERMKAMHEFAGEDPAEFARFLCKARGAITDNEPLADDVAVLVVRTGVPFQVHPYDGPELDPPRAPDLAKELKLTIDRVGAQIGFDKESMTGYIHIQERGEMTIAYALKLIVGASTDQGKSKRLVMNCLDMVSMDSTFLGFLHYLNVHCASKGIEFVICLARDTLIKNLLEMHMNDVLAHRRPDCYPWQHPLEPVCRSTDLNSLGFCEFAWDMHMGLRTLSPENDLKFAGVTDGLQLDVERLRKSLSPAGIRSGQART